MVPRPLEAELILAWPPLRTEHQAMLQRIDHLSIAVHSLEDSIPYYEKALGLKCEHVEEVAAQQVRTALFQVGETHLELLEPTSPESPVAKFLEKIPTAASTTWLSRQTISKANSRRPKTPVANSSTRNLLQARPTNSSPSSIRNRPRAC